VLFGFLCAPPRTADSVQIFNVRARYSASSQQEEYALLKVSRLAKAISCAAGAFAFAVLIDGTPAQAANQPATGGGVKACQAVQQCWIVPLMVPVVTIPGLYIEVDVQQCTTVTVCPAGGP